MEKNKVESRTVKCKVCGSPNHDYGEASRPSVPAQGQGDVDEIVTRLYRRFKDWSKRGFGPEDVTWCEVKADIVSMVSALAVSRSEVATGQAPQCISTNCPVWEFTHDIDAKGCISYRPGAPAAGLMPSCTVCGEIMQGVCKCGSKTGASRAAGSTERWIPVSEKLPEENQEVLIWNGELGVWRYDALTFERAKQAVTHWKSIKPPALAKTDTDVPKGE